MNNDQFKCVPLNARDSDSDGDDDDNAYGRGADHGKKKRQRHVEEPSRWLLRKGIRAEITHVQLPGLNSNDLILSTDKTRPWTYTAVLCEILASSSDSGSNNHDEGFRQLSKLNAQLDIVQIF
jgi:hypothetical protein